MYGYFSNYVGLISFWTLVSKLKLSSIAYFKLLFKSRNSFGINFFIKLKMFSHFITWILLLEYRKQKTYNLFLKNQQLTFRCIKYFSLLKYYIILFNVVTGFWNFLLVAPCTAIETTNITLFSVLLGYLLISLFHKKSSIFSFYFDSYL